MAWVCSLGWEPRWSSDGQNSGPRSWLWNCGQDLIRGQLWRWPEAQGTKGTPRGLDWSGASWGM